MPAACTVHVQCPECDVVVPIGCTVLLTTDDSGAQLIDVEPDVTEAWAHAWTHER